MTFENTLPCQKDGKFEATPHLLLNICEFFKKIYGRQIKCQFQIRKFHSKIRLFDFDVDFIEAWGIF